MTLQSSASSSNPLCLSEIKTEFSSISSNCLTGFYGAASGVPASGNICLTDFLGKSSSIDVSFDSSTTLSTLTDSSGFEYIDYISENSTSPLVGSPDWMSSINLYNLLTAAGWDGTSAVVANITINNLNTSHTNNHHWVQEISSNYNYGWITSADRSNSHSSTTVSGVTYYKDQVIPVKSLNFVSGAIPSGSVVNITNNGLIQGIGGAGGAGGTVRSNDNGLTASAGSQGAAGGPIFDLSAAAYDVDWNYTQGSTGKVFRGIGGAGGAGGYNVDANGNTSNSYGHGYRAQEIHLYNVTRNKFSGYVMTQLPAYTGSYGPDSSWNTMAFPRPTSPVIGLSRYGFIPRYEAMGGCYSPLQSFADAYYGSTIYQNKVYYWLGDSSSMTGPGGNSSGTQYYKNTSWSGARGVYLAKTPSQFTNQQNGGAAGPAGKLFKYQNSLGATVESDTPPYDWSGTVTVTA